MADDNRSSLFSSWDLLTLAGFAGLAWVWQQFSPGLPDPVPTHWNAAGQVNGWTPKAALPFVLFGLPLLIWGCLTLTTLLMGSAQEEGRPDQTAAMQPLRGLTGLGLCLVMGTILFIPASGPKALFIGLGGFFALLALGIALMARALKRMPRSQVDARCYRWGGIYYNPDDPRFLVEKRYGLGLTLNFAHRRSWLFLALALAPAVILLLGKWLSR